MKFPEAPRKPAPESVVPMINVVFLLLIFFLMSAQITPPAPFEVTPPQAQADQPADGEFTLYMDASGQAGFQDQTGNSAFAALSRARDDYCGKADCTATPPTLMVNADGSAGGAALAELIRSLGQAGFGAVQLVTRPGP
ncbi:ExbD/TolR family protein [Donghicola mangrovi]|uniref:Biopolymer transporter ExbD n=1 Tax=Donghicola mangrovi TaxID=2729614 RepID=A0A850Q8B1_9RHOB|nr:biopolymer transporter ExbD [Donghicola mangrovi]NVO25183.1 biopolymer transporter ExbD [Donghicola mangrovi]